jgi:uncharacterized protein (TIGR04255 family)
MSSVSPKFENPPVVETAIGIQFSELADFKQSHFGWFHREIVDEYPYSEDQARLLRLSEVFPRSFRRHGIQLKQMSSPDRVLYRDNPNDPTKLVQVQPDRFGFNWRRSSDKAPYPSFVTNLAECLSKYARFSQFCESQGLGPVVYVNHIFPDANESAQALFGDIFFHQQPVLFDDFLPTAETTTFNRMFELGGSHGRLYAEASVALHSERGDFISLRMIARVVCGDAGVEADIQSAHDWIVNGFVSLTNPQIRRDRWKQEPK